ncbi:LOW QUALITY PROTEIN: hypothetical protein OSB04_010019 [Centaurea solstitialis]|uniref:Uncharacterized protein n=1 Tax=Centaurea solstitialis TaxID=347529 RepID=A0AA38T6Q5_9ASTR|nr:LOW QUALITY PROTEIN: hypothetical protein OSB04_010019 [Centaurea solstitialis]
MTSIEISGTEAAIQCALWGLGVGRNVLDTVSILRVDTVSVTKMVVWRSGVISIGAFDEIMQISGLLSNTVIKLTLANTRNRPRSDTFLEGYG